MEFTKIILVVIYFCMAEISAQDCRSYQRLIGNCVSIKACPPLLHVLTNNPNAAQLRSLQKLTCGFDSTDPKVCCPIGSIVHQKTNTVIQPSIAPTTKAGMIDVPDLDPRIASTAPASMSSDSNDIQDYSLHPGFKQMPSVRECGIGVGQDRIIGGKNVTHGSYPWMARIGYKSSKPGQLDYHCGGSVISKRYILTAAHCTEGIEDGFLPVSIRVGEHDTETEEDCNLDLQLCSKVEDYKIEKIIPHSQYNINSKQNDLTLIRVDRDISFDTIFVHPVCLPFTKEYNFEFQPKVGTAIVAGFGRTKWNNVEGSSVLQEVTLPLKTNEECQAIYNRRITITQNQLCAGGEHGHDSCAGDSGGPLMVAAAVNRVPRVFQLGIVSFGPTHCGVGGLPGVYARTSTYLRWILDTMHETTPH